MQKEEVIKLLQSLEVDNIIEFKFKYSNPAGSNVTSLQACISLTGSTDNISYRDISKTGKENKDMQTKITTISFEEGR